MCSALIHQKPNMFCNIFSGCMDIFENKKIWTNQVFQIWNFAGTMCDDPDIPNSCILFLHGVGNLYYFHPYLVPFWRWQWQHWRHQGVIIVTGLLPGGNGGCAHTFPLLLHHFRSYFHFAFDFLPMSWNMYFDLKDFQKMVNCVLDCPKGKEVTRVWIQPDRRWIRYGAENKIRGRETETEKFMEPKILVFQPHRMICESSARNIYCFF